MAIPVMPTNKCFMVILDPSLIQLDLLLYIHKAKNLAEADTRHWNVGGWTLGSTIDDVGFTEALLTKISTAYTIDLQRVYSTGMSNGGYMSFLLACQLSDKIAAIASVTGSMTPQIL